jgi:hypothetical protein
MTSSRILFPQFRDEQSDSKYPFADSATLISSSTGIRIDPALFLDASFFGIATSSNLYISSIIIAATTVTITVGDIAGTKKLTGSFDAVNPPDNGVVAFTDVHGRPAGILLAEKKVNGKSPLNVFSTWSAGTHTFNSAATEFVATVVIPANEPGVRALTAEGGTIQTGDILVVGNAGVVLRVEGENTIRVDVVGVPLFKRLICAPQTTFPTKNYLRTINDCPADEYGNFVFTSTDLNVNSPAIRVYPTNNALNFNALGPKVK